MKKFTFIAALLTALTFVNSADAKCNIKATFDEVDGRVYYSKDHRLYKYVEINEKDGDKTFCSEQEARKAGYREAPYYFSNSTARTVNCIERERSKLGKDYAPTKCMGYVMGIYKSLTIYDKTCAPSHVSEGGIISAFLQHARNDSNNMDVEKYYGTTNSLMAAFPCSGSTIAKN